LQFCTYEIVFAHESRHSFVIHRHSLAPQLGCYPPIAVTPLMLEHNSLHLRSYDHFFFPRILSTQVTVKSGSAYARQQTHPLDA
jgi:hypothetical protein